MTRWIALSLALCAGAALAAPPLFGPYKHAPLAFEPTTQRLSTAAGGALQPLTEALPREAGVVTWAFATGDCGSERWGEGIDTERFARANVEAFVKAGVGYIVSTGGQGQQFHCDSEDGMERFIVRYASPRLVGFDFDIEAGQSDDQIDALVDQIALAQVRHPNLRISFTLPTFAASDGSRRSFNKIGERVLRAARRHRVREPVFNLMVMDYGDARAGRCVLKATDAGARCDMGRSALQAARNASSRYRLPLDRIEVTAMIGVNDVVNNVFTLDDARRAAHDVRAHGLAGLHYWALDRDTPCAEPASAASPTCSGLPQAPFEYTKAFAEGLR
jgi:hypothetical protein